HDNNVRLTGIIYLYEITQPRMTGTAKKNINMFSKLVGRDGFKNVILVTTKWDKLNDPQEGEKRESELKDGFEFKGRKNEGYWISMLSLGAGIKRHNGTTESAERILREFIGKDPTDLAILREIVDERKELNNTNAGREINKDL
ncbi:hypothetical protein K469DRAFT_525663, partial [Zopfia rhizophila CBS 207.26]